jgi:26S proteasome regulatory subunit N7
MTPLYLRACEQLKWPLDQKLHDQMAAKNHERLAELDAQFADAEKNFGETEMAAALLAKAHFYASILDKEKALVAYARANEKAVGVGARLDIVFAQLRLGLFSSDHDLISTNMEAAKKWDRVEIIRLIARQAD